MKKCPYCGFNNPDSATVCLNCGRSLLSVNDDNFIISPDGETSYIVDKENVYLSYKNKSYLPLLLDFLFLVLIWGILSLFAIFLPIKDEKFLLVAFFSSLFYIFVELLLLFFSGSLFGEIVIETSRLKKRVKILIVILWGIFPFVFTYILEIVLKKTL